ncbi:MAG TPA: HTH domain-containing protein [Chitinophagaceae bacterium]|jgi:predicted DNA-binding transcriptional regulator YafY|nr:HTH domain-containing protein [Chitinophagaceae bacterium]
MKFIDYSEKLDTIKYLAAHKRTGSPGKLAQKINVSRRTLLRMVQQLKDRGCPITFNRFRNTYEMKNRDELVQR